ncbi:hypothetical protein MYOV003v1_p0207 [Vibrio phage 207E48.1]|nr:hypothetical protein MYOV003v1_p0207 [Vibrio phage 207E48.1]
MKLTIPSINSVAFKKRMEDIAKRSVKLGLGEVSYAFLRDVYVERLGDDNVVYGQNYHEYEISGPNIDQPLSLGGYEFVGKIDHTHSEYMWKAYGDAELPPHILAEVQLGNKSYCEHCNTNRKRNNTFVVRNIETNNVVWVGSSCLKDFIGLDSPEQMVRYYQLLNFSEFEDDEDRQGSYNIFDVAMQLEKFLPRCRNISKEYGFVTGKEADEITRSTADDAFSAYWRTDRRQWNPVTGDDCEFVDDAIEWWLAQDAEGNEFIRNIQVLCNDMWCKHNERGIAAWIVGGYTAHLNKQNAEKRAPSEFYSEVGNKVNGAGLEAVVDRIWEYANEYGYEESYTYCYLMYTDEGHAIKMNSGKVLELGDRIAITSGSIKAHNTYENGDYSQKQTVLARPRFKVIEA